MLRPALNADRNSTVSKPAWCNGDWPAWWSWAGVRLSNKIKSGWCDDESNNLCSYTHRLRSGTCKIIQNSSPDTNKDTGLARQLTAAMKLGIVLVCVAAGVLLVANASEHEDDGHGSLVGPGWVQKMHALHANGLHALYHVLCQAPSGLPVALWCLARHFTASAEAASLVLGHDATTLC